MSSDFNAISIVYGKMRYATLEGTPPGERTLAGTQRGLCKLPDGWVLAKFEECVRREVVSKFPWGANRLVFSDGSAFSTLSGPQPGEPSRRASQILRCDESGAYGIDTSKACAEHTYRVLICTEVLTLADAEAHNSYCKQTLVCMWKEPDFTDCEVVCGDTVFKCHRVVLAQASPVFKRMLSGGMLEAKTHRIEVDIDDVDAVSAFLQYVYMGTIDCESALLPSLVKLADFYQMDHLGGMACEKTLRTLNKDTVIPFARVMNGIRERPYVTDHWTQLKAKVKDSDELVSALLSSM